MSPFDGVGEWKAYARRNPIPDPWWPLVFKGGFADIARTHPSVFGVWVEADDRTYTVAIKAEAKRERLAGYKITGGTNAREVKRRNVPDLLTLRTLLITLAKDPNTP